MLSPWPMLACRDPNGASDLSILPHTEDQIRNDARHGA
jgi:hypothetical protein